VLATTIGSDSVVSQVERARVLATDPVALGVIGAFAIGFIAAAVFAVLGFVVNAAVSARERVTEFALLRAVGLSGGQLSAWLSLESAGLAAISIIAGTALGLLLAWVVLPFVTVTQQAVAPVPPVEIVVPWTRSAARPPEHGRPAITSRRRPALAPDRAGVCAPMGEDQMRLVSAIAILRRLRAERGVVASCSSWWRRRLPVAVSLRLLDRVSDEGLRDGFAPRPPSSATSSSPRRTGSTRARLTPRSPASRPRRTSSGHASRHRSSGSSPIAATSSTAPASASSTRPTTRRSSPSSHRTGSTTGSSTPRAGHPRACAVGR
jgi:hypothetical protein